MTRRLVVLLLVLACLSGVRASAHHPFASRYVETNEVQIAGELVQFLHRNPHSVMHVLAPDDKGRMHVWAVEWRAGDQLNQQGITSETLRPGDHVVIKGAPDRDPAGYRIRVREIVRRSDGWVWRRPS